MREQRVTTQRVKWLAAVRGGILGCVIVAILLAVVGRVLELNLPPWAWSSSQGGSVGRAIELWRAVGILLPVAAVWTGAIAIGSALLFEFVAERASGVIGALVGLASGTATAIAFGLIPWAAYGYSYTYMPADAPLGPYNAAWAFAALMLAGAVAGFIAGAAYGEPHHRSHAERPIRWRSIYPASTHSGSR